MKTEFVFPEGFAKHLDNLDRAFASLEDFIATEPRFPAVLAGIVQAFEYTYELFWTGFQKIAQANNLPTGGPRQALVAANQLGLLTSEEVWLAMMKARNLSSHSYNRSIAEELVQRIELDFVPAFHLARAALDVH
jgi:nucleotidyltransferase substrate binding protein (TIGR01987 family)